MNVVTADLLGRVLSVDALNAESIRQIMDYTGLTEQAVRQGLKRARGIKTGERVFTVEE